MIFVRKIFIIQGIISMKHYGNLKIININQFNKTIIICDIR
jgi:hypothetical protein